MSKYMELANEMAKKAGFDAACAFCRHGKHEVFMAEYRCKELLEYGMYSEYTNYERSILERPKCEGYPTLILVTEDTARLATKLEMFQIMGYDKDCDKINSLISKE